MPLPAVGTVYAHYEADNLGLSNGATVTTWPDSGPNGHDLAQTGGAALPTYATNSLNSLGGVVFSGAERIAKISLTVPAPRTYIFVIGNPPNDGTVKYIYFPSIASLMAKWSNANRWIFGNSDTNFLEFTESGIVGTPGIWTFVHQGTGSFVRWNQTQKVSGNLSATSVDNAVVFSSTGNSGTNFTMYEFVIYDGALSGGDIDTVEDYLFTKWFTDPGITGTGASTLDGVTSAGTGQYGSVTGTGATTLDGVTSAGSGTYTPSAITGTGATTLDGVTSTGTGTFLGAITGTGTSTLDGVVTPGSGTFTLPTITGTGTPTLDGVTSTGVGLLVNPITGTGSPTLAGVTSTGSGVFASGAVVENVICGVEAAGAVCGVESALASCRIG